MKIEKKKGQETTPLKTYEIDRLDGTSKERFQVTAGSEPETLVKDYVSTNEYKIREIGCGRTIKSWIRIYDHAYENCEAPTGEDWTWSHWTHEKPHDFDYSLFHKNGVKCRWWIEVDLPQLIIDLHTDACSTLSAAAADRANDLVWKWIGEQLNLTKTEEWRTWTPPAKNKSPSKRKRYNGRSGFHNLSSSGDDVASLCQRRQ